MAKRKKNIEQKPQEPFATGQQVEPKQYRSAFVISTAIILIGLLAEIIIALVVYPSLPRYIPSGWLGWVPVGGTIPSWVVFLAFPGAQLIVLATAIFSTKDEMGRRVMGLEKAISLTLLGLLFTALQASALHIPR